MHDLAEAIRDLIFEYEKAIGNPKVRDPLGYALYWTWQKRNQMFEQIEGMCADD